MDFDKTSFSVDWFTPGGDKFAPKRLSFPKSARISIDDLVSDSPLSFCFSPVDEAQRSLSYAFTDTPFEKACGWTNSAPPSPLVPSGQEQSLMRDQALKTCEEGPTDWRSLASPGLLSIADDCALCGVDMDVSCLDALDEQLLVSPVECFTELCWQDAVRDDVTAPKTHKYTRSRARSFKCDTERPLPSSPTPRDYDFPGSFERTRPLAAKITLPLDAFPHSPSSYSFESHDMSPTFQEKKPLAYIMYTNPEGRILPFPAHDKDVLRRSKKRDLALTPSFESLALPQPLKPRLHTSKSSQTLRVISDACATFARGRRRSPF